MKNIIINGKFFNAPLEGMPRVGREVVAAIDLLKSSGSFRNINIKLYAPKKTINIPEFKNIEIKKLGNVGGFLWEQIVFPYYTKDTYTINFTNTATIFKRNGVVVVHDAQFISTPKSHKMKSLILYRLITSIVAKSYKNIITVSNYAKDQIISYGVTHRTDIKVIYNGADHITKIIPDDSILHKFSLSKGDYILSNSYIAAHKNVEIIFKAIKNRPDLCNRTVLFGSSAKNDYLKAKIEVPDGIRFVGRVSDAELCALMTNAAMFLFPSKTEGFGLPPLEAMAVGCATICSSTGAMKEVCDDGAIYASPDNCVEWLEAIDLLIKDPVAKRKLIENGKIRSCRFTWENTAKQYMDYINSSL